MGIEIVLYSSSPIIQKIFFHILYHYSPTVHRIDQPSMLMEKIKYNHPDIIFIDDLFAQESSLQAHIKEKTEELKNIPIILMAKSELDKKTLESSAARDFLKKPISADRLRELVTRFVPKTKSNILTQHLKFASIPNFEGEQDTDSPAEVDSIVSQDKDLQKNVTESSSSQSQDKSVDQKTHAPSEAIDPITVAELKKDGIVVPPPTESPTPKGSPTPHSKQEGSSKGIEPITLTQYTEVKEDDISASAPLFTNQEPDKVSDSAEVRILKREPAASKPPTAPELDASDQIKKEDDEKKTEEDFNTQLKNQIDDYIQKWAGEKIKSEVEEQLKNFVEQKSQDIIQKVAEKAVWQVVPELAKQLITKELDKLLKEEGTEDK